jgi:uncharacterized membrane protein (Fun14 family)
MTTEQAWLCVASLVGIYVSSLFVLARLGQILTELQRKRNEDR